MLTVGSACAGKGEKKTGFLVAGDPAGTSVEIPVTVVNGEGTGPTLWVNAGIHGMEYPGIEASIRLSHDISPHDLTGALIITPIVNVPGFFGRSMYVCPLDNKNLNRVFPGQSDGSMSDVIAYALMHHIAPQASYFIDLHSGDMVEDLYPFVGIKATGREDLDERSRDLASYLGVETLMMMPHRAENSVPADGMLVSAMAERNTPATICEVGGRGLLDEASVVAHYAGVINVMRHLGMLPGEAVPGRFRDEYDRFVWLYAKRKGLFYSRVGSGDPVAAQQALGEIRDYWGATLETIPSPAEGRILFLVANPAVTENGLLMGIGTASSKE